MHSTGAMILCKHSWCGPHRVPVDHATSEVDVRVLDARVHDVNTHTLTSKVAVVVLAVDRATCTGCEGWTITVGTN